MNRLIQKVLLSTQIRKIIFRYAVLSGCLKINIFCVLTISESYVAGTHKNSLNGRIFSK